MYIIILLCSARLDLLPVVERASPASTCLPTTGIYRAEQLFLLTYLTLSGGRLTGLEMFLRAVLTSAPRGCVTSTTFLIATAFSSFPPSPLTLSIYRGKMEKKKEKKVYREEVDNVVLFWLYVMLC